MFFLTEVVMESFNLQENNWKDVRKQKYKIGIFVTGKENYPEVLKKIVTKQVELSDNVC